ncbi:hypothetical protein BK634_18870 [Pseudomonas chlororaphis]|nr:hypothetical protein BK634_18870 [Pseudomonas chlororaphis]
MQIEYIWIALAVILLLVELWAIRRVLRSTSRSETKGLWMVVIVFVPLLELLVWAFVGPKEERETAPAPGKG